MCESSWLPPLGRRFVPGVCNHKPCRKLFLPEMFYKTAAAKIRQDDLPFRKEEFPGFIGYRVIGLRVAKVVYIAALKVDPEPAAGFPEKRTPVLPIICIVQYVCPVKMSAIAMRFEKSRDSARVIDMAEMLERISSDHRVGKALGFGFPNCQFETFGKGEMLPDKRLAPAFVFVHSASLPSHFMPRASRARSFQMVWIQSSG